MTDDEAFEEPVEQPRCPDCLSAVDPDQQYCLQCGERLAPAGPPPSSPLAAAPGRPPPRSWPSALLLLLLGGFGIAYGFTRDDTTTKAGRHDDRQVGHHRPAASRCRRSRSRHQPDGADVHRRPDRDGFPTAGPFPTGTDIPDRHVAHVPDRHGHARPDPGTTGADPGDEASDWPAGKNGFAVILSSDDTEQYTFESITAKKEQAAAKGFSNAGVLNSDDYFTLNPGYWVLFLGPYDIEVGGPGSRRPRRARRATATPTCAASPSRPRRSRPRRRPARPRS